MFDGLCRRQQPSIERRHSLEVFHDLGAFIRNAVDGFARLAARRLADDAKHLIEPLYLTLRFPQMLVEGARQLPGLGGFRHFRQRLDDLVLREINVLQRLMKEIAQRLLRFAGPACAGSPGTAGSFLCRSLSHRTSLSRAPEEDPLPSPVPDK